MYSLEVTHWSKGTVKCVHAKNKKLQKQYFTIIILIFSDKQINSLVRDRYKDSNSSQFPSILAKWLVPVFGRKDPRNKISVSTKAGDQTGENFIIKFPKFFNRNNN